MNRRWIVGCSARVLLGAAFFTMVASAGFPRQATARFNGIIGFSGKQGATCNQIFCHSGGVEPLVSFEGPDSVAPAETVVFRLVIVSQSPLQVAAGFNVAAGAGDLNILPDQGSRKSADEITHDAPQQNDEDGVATYDFTWTAPEEPGEYVLYGAGNSVDNSGGTGGDQPATTMRVIRVVGTCAGDCNEDQQVSIDELVIGINIATDLVPLEGCPALDADADGEVSIDELLISVQNALDGCL